MLHILEIIPTAPMLLRCLSASERVQFSLMDCAMPFTLLTSNLANKRNKFSLQKIRNVTAQGCELPKLFGVRNGTVLAICNYREVRAENGLYQGRTCGTLSTSIMNISQSLI